MLELKPGRETLTISETQHKKVFKRWIYGNLHQVSGLLTQSRYSHEKKSRRLSSTFLQIHKYTGVHNENSDVTRIYTLCGKHAATCWNMPDFSTFCTTYIQINNANYKSLLFFGQFFHVFHFFYIFFLTLLFSNLLALNASYK